VPLVQSFCLHISGAGEGRNGRGEGMGWGFEGRGGEGVREASQTYAAQHWDKGTYTYYWNFHL